VGEGAHPACAAEAALSRLQHRGGAHDAAAAQLLRALLGLLETAPLDAAAAADGDASDAALAAADAAASEAAYVAYLARINTATWLAVSVLSLMDACSHVFTAVRYVHLAPRAAGLVTAHMGATNAWLTSRALLLPVGGGAPLRATDVPFAVVVANVRVYAAGLLLFRLPCHVALLVAAVRMARSRRAPARYERTFFALMLVDTAFYICVDLLILRATGAVVEWPVWLWISHAVGLVVTHLRGPFRPGLTIASVTFRLLAFCWALAYAGGVRALVRDPGCLAMVAAVALTVWRAPRRDVQMRAAHAALLREEAARAQAVRLKAD
jgi:hypothetical protein